MTDEEMAEYKVLKLATDEGKFALQIGAQMETLEEQEGLQRLQMRGWVRLLDISPIALHSNHLFRIFQATSEALTWFNTQG